MRVALVAATLALIPILEIAPEIGDLWNRVALGTAVVAEVLVYRHDRTMGHDQSVRRRLYRWLAGGALLAGVSYVLGRTGSSVCEPASVFQFHALWHLATATAFGLLAETMFLPHSHVQPSGLGPTRSG